VVIVIVAILGISIIGTGEMASNQDNDGGHTSWFDKFKNNDMNSWFSKISNFFDYKKFTGFLNSGGSGGSNNNQDDDDDDGKPDDDDDDGKPDDDDDDGDTDVDQIPQSASASIDIIIREVEINGKKSLQNVANQCVFHSPEDFSPLCIKCNFLDDNGNPVATGELINPESSYHASDSLPIEMFPVSEVELEPEDPAPNDVQNIEKIRLELCDFKKPGYFVGGGRVNVPKYGGTYTLTHGFELHCDPTLGPNNLEINWMKNKFHLEELEEAECTDDGSTNEPPPSAATKTNGPGPTLDVYYGNGYGRYNGQCGAFAEWVMDDNGEPGKADQIVALRITGADNAIKLEINKDDLDVRDTSGDNPLWLNLKTGNHQWVPHPSTHPNPPTHTTPCPEMTP